VNSGATARQAAEVETDGLLRAMAASRRRAIMVLVSDRERSAGEIAAEFDVSRTAISQHLTVLREAGLISERREGTRRFYRGERERVAQLRDALDGIWGNALSSAKTIVETDRER
jgi:DNA-binding transcriptional ArsR family regulator